RPAHFLQFLPGLWWQVLMDRHEVVSLPPGFREPPRETRQRISVSPASSTVPPALRTSIVPALQSVVWRSASDLRSQARISSIWVKTNRARLRLSLGNMGGVLVRKLVKPTKIICSWTPYQR